ncbi:hypothetical protein [Methylobacterium haplocladii]|uniref:Uncharacterized protein n=1 Tax=Methylobacterium haplocladii TaxID=1176176 RepID=A0A512INN9_9HYPH|nr:hypothetical protein [Methylobacterium haplocladii]GEO99324.1 hypothetical protein MHA02_17120 [Methylobacterium haplocladii]GJD83474.1 hypothetical protein HPGCJGGD_1341 [Methylobacterium haplocladii]GLS60042.1 hypothetical protein GCM10007887_27180 [Methylobacterium haplocladii]
MTTSLRGLLLAALVLGPASAADLSGAPVRTGRFLATCEDLGQFCFADACGRNQIDAALNCRALCPNSAILSVVPGSCPLPLGDGRVRVRLRAKG